MVDGWWMGLENEQLLQETYPAMGTISPPTLLRRLVHLDVLDYQVARIKAFGVRIGLGVAKESQQKASRLLGPAGSADTKRFSFDELARVFAIFEPKPLRCSPDLHRCYKKYCPLTLCSAAGTSCISPHRNCLLVVDDIFEERDRSSHLPAVDSLSCFTGLLERHPKVSPSRTSRLGGINARRSVANLVRQRRVGVSSLS